MTPSLSSLRKLLYVSVIAVAGSNDLHRLSSVVGHFTKCALASAPCTMMLSWPGHEIGREMSGVVHGKFSGDVWVGECPEANCPVGKMLAEIFWIGNTWRQCLDPPCKSLLIAVVIAQSGRHCFRTESVTGLICSSQN